MKSFLHIVAPVLLMAGLIYSSSSLLAGSNSDSQPSAKTPLKVLSSPTCGCCSLWVEHLEANGVDATIHHPEDLNQEKSILGIAPRYQSCHTAISQDGYVFEGHIPAKVIQRFLAEKPRDAIGLAVPGMPIGSPGMEMDNRFSPYEVLLLMTDGSSSVYTRIDTFSEQH